MCKEIPLTQGKFAIVDGDDFDELNKHKWYYFCGYAARKYNHKVIMMHRIINNTPKEMSTDHIDRNKLNNTKANLRSCNVNQNNRNIDRRKNNTSGYVGVNKHGSGWRAYIKINNKQINLGTYIDIVDAAKAYNKKALELFGEFSVLNVV
jgi:hypothetical protein